MAGIRMLALDVDGTLAARGDEVTPGTRDALHRAWELGIEVVIATGRRYRSTRRVIEALGLPVNAVVLGGSLIKEGGGRTLGAKTFEAPDFASIHTIASDRGHAIVCQRDSSERGGVDFLIDAGPAWNEPTRLYFEGNSDWAAPAHDLEAGCPEALVIGAFGRRADLEELAAAVETRHPGRFLASVLPVEIGAEPALYLEFTPANVSKWTGLVELAERAGHSLDAICAVGDQRNDLPMIREAGMGVAMGNAIAAVKEAADWVTGRCDEDGLVAVVERVLEEG